MGLAAPKQRSKISHDPNNTKWTNDTESFGHKIMASHGWKPGEYLGAKNAPHAEFHTAANSSHIRVMIKDDNLGLGAKIGSGVGHGECTGLDAFKDLLGRLNGKDDEELEKEQKSREDLKRAIYTERKWGSIRFVQGGFLIGDKIQSLIDDEAERVRILAGGGVASPRNASDSSDSSDSDEISEPVLEKSRKSKKRKLEEVEETPQVFAVKVKKSKKQRRSEAAPEDASEIAAGLEDVKISKKSKKSRQPEADIEDSDEASEIKKRKKEKKEKKKDKKDRKEKSKSRNEEESTKESKKKSKRDKRKADLETDLESSKSTSIPTTKENTPSTPLEPGSSGRSTPIMLQGRHAVRARNIAQKRLASMDVAALNQIFMIKS